MPEVLHEEGFFSHKVWNWVLGLWIMYGHLGQHYGWSILQVASLWILQLRFFVAVSREKLLGEHCDSAHSAGPDDHTLSTTPVPSSRLYERRTLLHREPLA